MSPGRLATGENVLYISQPTAGSFGGHPMRCMCNMPKVELSPLTALQTAIVA